MFEWVNDVTYNIVHVNSLTVDKNDPMVKAERVRTKYGETILLSIRDSAQQLFKLFLPKRYGMVFKDEDITSINEG